jgi:hypothetical protein
MNSIDVSLTKNERVVINTSKPMKVALAAVAKQNCITVSELIRECVFNCMETQYPQFGEVYSVNLPVLEKQETI